MRKVVSIVLLVAGICAFAAPPQVPAHMEFAGLKLHIKRGAQAKIQQEVDKLHHSPKFFQQYVNQADLFFPLVEEIFAEEGFPKDFRYLIIQESGFKADAVSSSNAVGYWQFKKGTAQEVGLRVDHLVDERKNIAAASRGAAKYMNKINLKTQNWIYALLAYNRGPGGVMKYVEDKYVGASKMEITRSTHWYVIKMLAHKIAFENYVGLGTPPKKLIRDMAYGGKTLKNVAKHYKMSVEELERYNRWIATHRKIPKDRNYEVIVPVASTFQSTPSVADHPIEDTKNEATEQPKVFIEVPKESNPQPIKEVKDVKENFRYRVNGIDVITAATGDNSARLAIKGGVTKKKFLRYNEMKSFEELIPGKPYFVKGKKRKALVSFHTVKSGDSQWSISQEYGITTLALRTKNHLERTEALVPGRVLWLRKVRPESVPVQYDKSAKETKPVKEEKIEVKQEEGPPKIQTEEIRVKVEVNAVEPVKEVDPKPKEKTSNPDMTKVHVVGQGESLYAIAKKYEVTVDQIKSWNGLTSNAIDIGQQLQISSPTNENEVELYVPAAKRTHAVAHGETLWAIAQRYGVTPEGIMKINNLADGTLTIGQKLLIPSE